jgi:hypothetical protein
VKQWAGQILVVARGSSLEGAGDRSIGHLLATLGRLDEADNAYTTAAHLEHASGFPPLEARTLYWHGRLLLERNSRGDRDRAADLLAMVTEVTEAIGMRLLNAQASYLLERTRADTKPSRARSR